MDTYRSSRMKNLTPQLQVSHIFDFLHLGSDHCLSYMHLFPSQGPPPKSVFVNTRISSLKCQNKPAQKFSSAPSPGYRPLPPPQCIAALSKLGLRGSHDGDPHHSVPDHGTPIALDPAAILTPPKLKKKSHLVKWMWPTAGKGERIGVASCHGCVSLGCNEQQARCRMNRKETTPSFE